MPKRNSADHSTGYSERYADETVGDSKQSRFALDHPPDDWRQTDFAHRFTDELKALSDTAAANFDSNKKLTEYSGDERKELAYATAAAFRSMDFADDESKVEAALDLSHTLLDPVAQDIRLEDAQLQQKDIDLLKRAGVDHVLVVPPDPANPDARTYEFVVENMVDGELVLGTFGAVGLKTTGFIGLIFSGHPTISPRFCRQPAWSIPGMPSIRRGLGLALHR